MTPLSRLPSVKNMRHDMESVDKLFPLPPEDDDRWFNFVLWLNHYWWPTRGWTARLSLWWHYNVRRYPKPPPLDQDPVYKRLFGEKAS